MVYSSGAHAGRPRVSGFTIGCIGFGAATVLFLLWIVLLVDGARVTDGVDDLGELVAAAFGACLCFVAAKRSDSSRAAWAFLGAGCGAWAIGEALWSYYDLVDGTRLPFPSLADVGFTTMVPLTCIGICLFPCFPRKATHRIQGLLDGLIIAVSLLFASWTLILGPIHRAHVGGSLAQVLSLAYPMGDVVMLSLVIILVARSGGARRGSFSLVFVGVVGLAVADSSFTYLTQVNNYGNGTFLDTGWVAGFFLIGLGALHDFAGPAQKVMSCEVPTMSLVAPYAPVLVVLAVTGVQLMRGHHFDSVSLVLIFPLILLVLGRELLRLWDENSLGPLEDPRTVSSRWTGGS